MSETRIYRVDDGETAQLVRAPSQAQAVRHCAKRFSVKVASQDDLCTLLTKGVKVEESGNGEESGS